MAEIKPPNGVIEAPIHFLERNHLYEVEKPYTMFYDPGEDFPLSNMKTASQTMNIQSMRDHCPAYSRSGFQFATLDSSMKYDDYSSHQTIQDVHYPEVENLVKRLLRATLVKVVHHTIRKRHSGFPYSTGEIYEYSQPGNCAHVDFTMESASSTIKQKFKQEAKTVLSGEWQIINVWHPLHGPLYDWPLAICDASTLDFQTDTEPCDEVEASGGFESLQIYHNPQQKWYYLPKQESTELLIFKNADSESKKGKMFTDSKKTRYKIMIADKQIAAAHAAIDISHMPAPMPVRPRESIEIRIVVSWSEDFNTKNSK